jgi:UDP-N-acetyl-2-amino-2-deoxyglucuronate dehydrogenase
MPERIRFGVTGCGRMGLRRIRTIANHPRTELAFVCDNNEELAKKTAVEWQCDYFVDLEKAVKQVSVDCVVVSVPNKFHPSAVIQMLNEGKHVFCEKPLSRNPQEGIEMVKAAIANKKSLKVGSNLRYFPSVLKAKELLDDKAIGDPIFIRGWVGNAGWQVDGWYSDIDMIGGGTFLDNGSHLLDIYRWFLGEVEECTGFTSTNYWQIAPLEDNAMGVFKFKGGQLGFLHSSWTEWVDYMYMEIYGKDGYIRIDNRNPNSLTVLGRKVEPAQLFDFSRLKPQSYDLEFNYYVGALEGNQQPLPSGFDGLRAVQMAWGVYESSQTGKKVSLWGEEEERLYREFSSSERGRR